MIGPQEHVLQEMRSYDASDSSQFLPQIDNLREKRSLFWWPGSLTAQETFEVTVTSEVLRLR
jgi:hypothetical protein